MLNVGSSSRAFAGFDFPIGLPESYGISTGLSGFREVLTSAGRLSGWERFFDVADVPGDIQLSRPFYPRSSKKGVSRASLWGALGVSSFEDLLRECERGGPGRREACSIFWTLGGNQVGRAAAAGWQEIVRPALEQGARLWPFDGTLPALSQTNGLVLAETYPADAYAVVGAPFSSRESKTSQTHRASKAEAILAWAKVKAVDLSAVEPVLTDGFGVSKSGEDPFDALLGLLAMIAVVDGDLQEATATLKSEKARWEGWILGR